MTVPSAVERQAAEADKAFDEFDKMLNESAAEEASPPEGDTPPTQPPAPPAAPAVTPDSDALKRQLDYEKHRNDSLQGRLDSQLRAANQELKQLRELVAKLSEKPAAPAVPATKKHLKPEELANLDDATLDVQGRVAKGVAEEQTDTVRAELERKNAELLARIEALEQGRTDSVVATFWDAVEKLSPGAKAMNESDPAWFAFLDGIDELSGRPRREIGVAAYQLNDVKRIVALVDEFRQASGAPAPKPTPVVRPEVTPRPGSGAPPVKPLFKESQVKRFYENLTRGAYKGREKEAEEMENQIDAAMQEGRIVAG